MKKKNPSWSLYLALAGLASWLGIWWAFFPIAPASLRLAVPSQQGEYAQWAQRYAQNAARHGVQVQIIELNGPREVLTRLSKKPDPDIDLAFLPGGFGALSSDTGAQGLLAVRLLANVRYEPLWIFSRKPQLDTLSSWVGTTLAAGPSDSASRSIMTRMIDLTNLPKGTIKMVDLHDAQAVHALREGQVDAVAVLGSTQYPPVKALLSMPGVSLVSLRAVHTVVERTPYLSTHLLPAYGVDRAGRQPPRDGTLLALTASLVARGNLDPRLAGLASALTLEQFASADLLNAANDFPNLAQTGFEVDPPAREILSQGLPWLDDTLPYWWAQAVRRLLFLGLPVLLAIYGVFALIRRRQKWQTMQRINRSYGQLKIIEDELAQADLHGLQLVHSMERLRRIERETLASRPPAHLTERVYTMLHHIAFVRRKLKTRQGR